MVVLRNCGESESDKAIEYSEELDCFYFPPSPPHFPPSPPYFPLSPPYFPPSPWYSPLYSPWYSPLYSPPAPLRPSSSNSSVAYVWNGVTIFVPQNDLDEDIVDLPGFHLVLLVEHKIQDRGGALNVIPSGRLVKINELVEGLDDIVDSEAKKKALEFVHENCSLTTDLRQDFEPLEKQNEDIVDQLLIDSVNEIQYLIQYRDGTLNCNPLWRVSRCNGSEISDGKPLTSTLEPMLIFQTKLSLRLNQGHRGQWVADICYGWNWLNMGTFKTAEGAHLSSESVIRFRGGKDLFDYSFPKLFLNKNREEPTRASRTGVPPLQSLPTEQQENPNDHLGLGCSEATGNDEFEAVGIGSESTVECKMAEARLNSRCLGKRKRKEKNTGRERRNKGKTNGVRIPIPLEDILQTKGMQLKDAAKHLQVSPSTLKRVCRGYNINKWPPQEEYKLIGESRPKEDDVIVKAKNGSYTLRFPLYRPWEKAKLEEQVKKRLSLEAGTYHIKYKDDEDGELILITCNEDLQLYIETSRLQGTTTSIEVLLEQK